MNILSHSKWEENALITISGQVAAVERKLNVLLQRDEQLRKLSKTLEVSTDSLAASVKAAEKQQKEEK